MGVASEFAWPDGASSALSLTFDGGYPEHWEMVAPILAEAGVRGTFFLTVPSLLDHPDAWKKLAAQGHEIGSHSHFGVSTNGELPAWTIEMVRDDLRMTDKGIVEVVETPVISFALSGESTMCSEGDYRPLIQRQFSSARAVNAGSNDVNEVDVFDVKSLWWQDLVGGIESYLPTPGHWSVPVFGRFFDVGFGAAEDDLRFLLGHLARRKDIWVAPFGEVAEHISKTRGPAGSTL